MAEHHSPKAPALAACVILAAVLFAASGMAQTEMDAVELVARHLESIGAPEARAVIKNRALNGTAEVVFRIGNHGSQEGGFSFLSEGKKVRLGMRFASADYPGEQIAYDGKDSTTGFLTERVRSTFESLFYQYDYPETEGLLGGVLSVAWPLLDLKGRQPRLEYDGLTEMDGRQLHELKYRARKGDQGYLVTLYFEPDTFRHVRTRYRLKVGYLIGPDDLTSARQEPSYYDLQEDFGDFRTVDGITLPHSYKISLNVSRKDISMMTEWNATVTKVFHNQRLDPGYFRIK